MKAFSCFWFRERSHPWFPRITNSPLRQIVVPLLGYGEQKNNNYL